MDSMSDQDAAEGIAHLNNVNGYIEALKTSLPTAVMRGIFVVVYRTYSLSHPELVPYIAVVLQSKGVLRFKPKEWMTPECLARIALEAP